MFPSNRAEYYVIIYIGIIYKFLYFLYYGAEYREKVFYDNAINFDKNGIKD